MNHIAMLIPTIDQIGGAERQVVELSKALAAKGWRVTLITLSGNSATAEELADSGVTHLSLDMRKAWIDPRGWLRYRRWARQHTPEIVHAHLPHATYFARFVRLIYPVRVVIDTIHTSSTGSALRQRAYRFTSPLSNWTTCVSNAVANKALEVAIVSPSKLSVIPNGVHLPAEPHTIAKPRNFRWIAVGRLAPVKDYPTLIRALAQLPNYTHLEIAGTGPEEHRLRTLANELRIADRVHFAGFHSDVQPLLANADAFVLASLWEGLPVSVLEASAAGLPVVATDGSGTREAMISDVTGLIVPVGNAMTLADAMSAIMALTHNQRRQMGAHGRQLIRERFTLPIIVNRWEELYRRLLAEHPNPKRRA
jgi:glycosyltransferase involved in cell wall biosynthesis